MPFPWFPVTALAVFAIIICSIGLAVHYTHKKYDQDPIKKQ
ncbi:hypothetical protein SAMN05216175_110154 [Neptunomonas qingdaonensis]|uniref:Uncharacterized protein n=1 Tax=Neptunomonas qingdaonensis TaxID=1045558 RepID=A0A1I2TNU9_9GAMM|nr:hypothetical protein SAMN05216175_110154 [Neptunomonas qingdaonensis]